MFRIDDNRNLMFRIDFTIDINDLFVKNLTAIIQQANIFGHGRNIRFLLS
jgi:hypothetical protein